MVLTLMFEQSDHTAGFHLMKSALEKVPNIAAIDSHVSVPVIWYHAIQLLVAPVGTSSGALVTVGGMGNSCDAQAATQYQ